MGPIKAQKEPKNNPNYFLHRSMWQSHVAVAKVIPKSISPHNSIKANPRDPESHICRPFSPYQSAETTQIPPSKLRFHYFGYMEGLNHIAVAKIHTHSLW